MKSTRKKTIAAVGLFILGGIAVAFTSTAAESREVWDNPYSASFPGKQSEVSSPNRLFKIIDAEGHHRTMRGHSLFLLDNHNRRIPITNPVDGNIFYRSMEVLWCPDSTCFILNYWRGSNETISYLYRVSDLEHPVDINQRIQSELEKRFSRENLQYPNFLYVFADHWLDAKTVKIDVTINYTLKQKQALKDGQMPANEFYLSYKWNLKDTFTLIKAK
jgi:hypothetical protein